MSLLSRQGTNQIDLTQGNARVTNSGIINALEMGRPTLRSCATSSDTTASSACAHSGSSRALVADASDCLRVH